MITFYTEQGEQSVKLMSHVLRQSCFSKPYRQVKRADLHRFFKSLRRGSLVPQDASIPGTYAGHDREPIRWSVLYFPDTTILHIGCVSFDATQTAQIKKWALAYKPRRAK